jgi:uncharacterized damage-inducible protein DinB
MIAKTIVARPAKDEYGPFYDNYINLVPHQDLIQVLRDQKATTARLLEKIPEDKAGRRYAPDKWSIKEVVGHLCDTERIMTYRALRIARGDQTPLPGFEQDDYVRQAGFDLRRIEDLISEYTSVRDATLSWLRGLDIQALQRRGTANNMGVSVLALAYIIAGHERHHVGILQERYLPLI